MKLISEFFKKNSIVAGLTTIFLIFQVVGTLGVPFLVANLIDIGIASGDIQKVIVIGIQMTVVAILSALSAVGGSYYSADLGARFGYEVRKVFFTKVQEFSIKDSEKYGISSIAYQNYERCGQYTAGYCAVLSVDFSGAYYLHCGCNHDLCAFAAADLCADSYNRDFCGSGGSAVVFCHTAFQGDSE